MPEGGVHGAQIVLLLLLLFVTTFAALARKLQMPFPIVLVAAGLLLSFVRGFQDHSRSRYYFSVCPAAAAVLGGLGDVVA